MAISRAQRRSQRQPRATSEYGDKATAALDVLELTEYAGQDCYRDVSPPADVIDDIFVVAQGDLARLIATARAAVTEFRDVRVAADRIRRA